MDYVIRNNALIADQRTYTSDAFGKMLQVFGVTELPITSAQEEPDGGDSRNFAVTGGAQIFSQPSQPIRLYLDFALDGSFQFQFTTTLPSLSLDTLRSQRILPSSALSDIPELSSIEFNDVELSFDSERTEIYFAQTSSTAPLAFLAGAGLSLNAVGFEFLRGYDDNTAALYLHAGIMIGETPIDTQIEVPLATEMSPCGWVFTIDSTVQLSSGLREMVAFLDSTSLAGTLGLSSFAGVFPDELHAIPTLFLDDIHILFDPLEVNIQFLSFRVHSVHPLELAGGQFTIKDVGIRVNITPRNGLDGLSLTLFGSIEIKDDVALDISVMLPEDFKHSNWVFSMSGAIDLQSINDLSLLPMGTPVGELNLPHDFFNLQSLSLGLFEVGFNPLQQTVSAINLHLGIGAACDLIHGLSLNNPTLTLDVSNPFEQSALPSRSIAGSLWGTIAVGDIQFGVDAEKQAQGWSFTGRTEQGSITIGTLVSSLGQRFNITMPDFVGEITLDDLSLQFSTTAEDSEQASESVVFNCEGNFPIYHDRTANLQLSVNVSSGAGSTYSCHLNVQLTIGDLQFSGIPADDYFIATYSHSGNQKETIRSLVENISPEVASLIPEIGLSDVLFAYSKAGGEPKFLFGVDIGPEVNLSHLPLVGSAFYDVSIDDLQFLIASKGFTQPEVVDINQLLPAGVTRLPEPSQEANSQLSGSNGATPSDTSGTAIIPAGLSVSARMNFGGWARALGAPVEPGESALEAESGTPAQAGPASSGSTKWLNLQRTLGPVYLDKVGVQYRDATLWLLLNASLSGAALTISLDGLSVGSPLKGFSPSFDLRGLGIDFQSGAVEIGGAFLRAEPENAGQPDQYDGTAVIKTAEATLSALGSYAELGGQPSLFIYAFLDYPLGGPAFFFVTGLAAGFGFNRKLIAPSIDSVADFPLVQQAVSGVAPPGAPDTPERLQNALKALQQYVPPAAGEVFLAVGVRFNSFKLIDSFALLTVEFGGHFVANILGLSTAIIPTPEAGRSVTPLAEVQIAWKAAFDPADGFLGVNAQLTPRSYILSRDCHLTGGYAFYSWLSGEHAGDFVQTLGGYHPRFVVPAHYPVVPRLGYTWKVSSVLTIKGDAYYALTGSALMAGGHLEVLFDEGDLKAWLKLGADFLISWKPYHYDAEIYVDVGVSYTFDINLLFGHVRVTISVDVGADLHLWGPDFSGTAEIDISVISFTVSFGAGASQRPGAIDWDTFRNSFLPAEKVCSISAKDGLVRKVGEGDAERWIINPKDFSLVINSAIPLKSGKLAQNEQTSSVLALPGANTQFGVGPMNVGQRDLDSTLTITVMRGKSYADDEFSYVPILKRVPAGLWGESLTPDLNANTFIEDVPTGFEIRPSRQPDPGITSLIDLGKFKYTSSYFPKDEGYPDDAGCAYAWEPPASFVVSTGVEGRGAVRDSIGSNQLRASLLSALNVDVDVNVGGNVADDLLSVPRVGTFSA